MGPVYFVNHVWVVHDLHPAYNFPLWQHKPLFSREVAMNPLAILLTSLVFLAGFPAQAKEGFFLKEDLPPQLRSAWEATFMTQSPEERSYGTAFVIDKQAVTSSRTRLLLLTTYHMVRDTCEKPLGYCPKMKLSASTGVDESNNSPILMDNRGRSIHEVEVVDRNKDYDLALLEVTVDREKYASVQPIPFISDCGTLFIDQKIYLIGFPNISSRTAPGALAIEKKNHIIRRGSQGHITAWVRNENQSEEHQSKFYWTGATADALPGSSGGPALTDRGEFFGVLHSIRKSGSQEEKHPFMGNDKEYNWHSKFTNCWAVNDFLSH